MMRIHYLLELYMVDIQPWPSLWPLRDAASLSLHFGVQLGSVPQT